MVLSSKKAQFGIIIQAAFTVLILVTVLTVLFSRFSDFPQVNEVPAKLNDVTTQGLIFEAYQKGLMQSELSKTEKQFTNSTKRSIFSGLGEAIDESCLQNSVYIISTACNGFILSQFEEKLEYFVYDETKPRTDDYLLRLEPKKDEVAYVYHISFYAPLHKLELKGRTVKGGLFGMSESYAYEERKEFSFNALPNPDVPYGYWYEKPFTIESELSNEMKDLLEVERSYEDVRRILLEYILPKKNAHNTVAEWTNSLTSINPETGSSVPSENAKRYVRELKQEIQKDPMFTGREVEVFVNPSVIVIILPNLQVQFEVVY